MMRVLQIMSDLSHYMLVVLLLIYSIFCNYCIVKNREDRELLSEILEDVTWRFVAVFLISIGCRISKKIKTDVKADIDERCW